jgi:hypothetical protein
VEIKHAYKVFSFRRMQSFHVNYWLQVSGGTISCVVLCSTMPVSV